MAQTLSAQFERDGFVIVPDAIDAATIAALRNAAAGIVDAFDVDANKSVFCTNDRDSGRDDYFFESAEAVHCFLEEGAIDDAGNLLKPKALAINKIGHALHDRHDQFAAFCRLPLLGELVRELGLEQPVVQQSMYIFKQPNIGGEVRWHQDASYLSVEDGAGIGIWVALEDATQDNGCLWMMPGEQHSALREIYEVDWATGVGTLRTLDDAPWQPEGVEPVPVEVKAGSLVLFADRIPHYSAANTSSASRHAMIVHVIEREARWSAKNWLQRRALQPFAI